MWNILAICRHWKKVYELLFSDNEYQKIPIFSIMFSLALYFWMIAYALIFAISKKIVSAVMPLGLVLILMLTVFAGPCALVRYAFPYLICIPVIYAVVFSAS